MTAVMRLLVKVAERSGVADEDTKEVRDFAHETDPLDAPKDAFTIFV